MIGQILDANTLALPAMGDAHQHGELTGREIHFATERVPAGEETPYALDHCVDAPAEVGIRSGNLHGKRSRGACIEGRSSIQLCLTFPLSPGRKDPSPVTRMAGRYHVMVKLTLTEFKYNMYIFNLIIRRNTLVHSRRMTALRGDA
jgi:hypothetical protein